MWISRPHCTVRIGPIRATRAHGQTTEGSGNGQPSRAAPLISLLSASACWSGGCGVSAFEMLLPKRVRALHVYTYSLC
jgi:hypothetical protein